MHQQFGLIGQVAESIGFDFVGEALLVGFDLEVESQVLSEGVVPPA